VIRSGCKLQEAKNRFLFPILDCSKSCKKKSQLTFRCQVNDYSSTDNIDHFDNLIGVGFAPCTKRLGAILRLRWGSAGSTEAQEIQLTILKEVGSIGRGKGNFVAPCGWLRQSFRCANGSGLADSPVHTLQEFDSPCSSCASQCDLDCSPMWDLRGINNRLSISQCLTLGSSRKSI
jgi:hypothetical protein